MATRAMDVTLHPMTKADWGQVQMIYREGLATGLAAFMSDPPTWTVWNAGHLEIGRTVARSTDETIAGWAALAPVPDT
jgi:L-amino acid N-acyltransferase YncA